MIIDSGYVGMESERLYKSSKSSRVTSGSGVYGSNGTGSQLTPFNFSNYLQQGTTEEEEETKTPAEIMNCLKKSSDEDSDETSKSKENSLLNTNSTIASARNILGMNAYNRVSTLTQANDAASTFSKLRELCIRHIFDLLFGGKSKYNSEATSMESSAWTESNPTYELVNVCDEVSYYEQESEETSFTAGGVVKTADGRSIDFNMNISMSRSFAASYSQSFNYQTIQVCDPLVINLEGNIAGLSDQKFFFDLDADGESEEISRLDSVSGYLALDKNEDGLINDGSELFGTSSGNGFKDLSTYDEDGNGWIDENDSIFTKLKIWTQDENGNNVLYTLKDKNVGAMYLGNSQTQFSLNSSVDNKTNGYIRNTGVFLFEDGVAGTLQHLDVAT